MKKALVSDKNVSIVTLSKLNNFFYGDFYLGYISLLTALFYYANLSVIGLILFVLLACFILLLFRDLTPLIPLPLFVVLVFRDLSVFSNPQMILIFIPVIICFIAHFIMYPVKKIFIGKLFFPIIAVCFALFLGGLFSEYIKDYFRGIPTIIMIGPIVFIAYFLFSQYLQPAEAFNLPKFMFATITFLGFTTALEIFGFKCKFFQIKLGLGLGWGNINSAASILLLAIPSCIYMILYGKSPILYVGILISLYASAILTGSEATIGISFVFAPIIAITVLIRGKLKSKKFFILKNAVYIIASIMVIALLVVTALGFLDDALQILFNELSNDSSRTNIYQQAFDLFKKYPIFGVGLGYVPDLAYNPSTSLLSYNFHSTLMHVLATMGLVGLLAYTYYFVARYKIILNDNLPDNLFAFFTFTMFEIYAMVDTGEFSLIPLMLTVTILLAVIEFSNNNPHRHPLPLALNMNFENVFNTSSKKTARSSLSKKI